MTPEQKDALLEIFNVGIGRAVAALSEMLSQKICFDIPVLNVMSADDIQYLLSQQYQGEELLGVHQTFEGDYSGTSFILFHEDMEKLLEKTFGQYAPKDMRDIVQEVGNIFISACIGVIANFFSLKLHLNPSFYFKDFADRVLSHCHIDEKKESLYLVLKVTYNFKDEKDKHCFVQMTDLTGMKTLKNLTNNLLLNLKN